MALERIRSVLVCLLLLALLSLVIILAVTVRRVEPEVTGAVKELRDASASLNQTSASVAGYVEAQKRLLESDRSQKAMQAGIEAAAVYKASGQYLNRFILPEARNLLVEAQSDLRSLRQLTDDTNASLNQKLVPEIIRLASNLADTSERFGVTVDELNRAIAMAAEKTGKNLDKIYELLARQEIIEILKNIEGTTANAEQMSASAAEAMKQMPEIAESLNKIAKTSSKFTKTTLIVNILATIARAFIP